MSRERLPLPTGYEAVEGTGARDVAIRSEAKVEGCTIKPLSEAKPEWQRTGDSLSELIRTGQYEIRAAYRFKACDNEFTIYVLQNLTDRSAVFECSSDDTYRPVVPCFRVGAAEN